MHALKTSRSSSSKGSSAKFAALKDEAIAHARLFTTLTILFRLVFYRDAFSTVLSFVSSFYWLFILPGTALMLYWCRRFGFVERVAVGTAAAFAVLGTASYYIAIFGFHVRYHQLIFPPLLVGMGVAAFWLGGTDSET